MLIFGSPELPEQRGMPHPPVQFALEVPLDRTDLAVLHRFGCPKAPEYGKEIAAGAREIVYSTTFDEIFDYAGHTFGDEGWISCHVCGG